MYSVQTVLLSIQSLLDEPNNNSPLNSQAAEMWPRKEGIQLITNSKDFRHIVMSRFPGITNQ